ARGSRRISRRSTWSGGIPMPPARYSTLTAMTPSTQSAGASGSKHAAASHPRSASPGFLPWRSWAAQAAIRAGQGEQAAGLIADELILARRAANSRSAGIALRASGLIAEGDQAIALLADSVDALEATSGRLELARSLTELGSALRRSGQRSSARPVLRRALDIATSCGAQVLAERARAELLATGSR